MCERDSTMDAVGTSRGIVDNAASLQTHKLLADILTNLVPKKKIKNNYGYWKSKHIKHDKLNQIGNESIFWHIMLRVSLIYLE